MSLGLLIRRSWCPDSRPTAHTSIDDCGTHHPDWQKHRLTYPEDDDDDAKAEQAGGGLSL